MAQLVYKFDDFKVGTMVINGHQVEVAGVYASGELRGWSGCHAMAGINGGEVKAWRIGHLCKELGVEYAKSRTGRVSGTKVTSTKTEEERIEAKAHLAYKDAKRGLEAMAAAGLLNDDSLAAAQQELDAKIKAEQERLTKEALEAKVKAAEEAAKKKAAKAKASKFDKAAKALDALSVEELLDFIRKYQDNRLAK